MSNHRVRRANDAICEITIRLLRTGQVQVSGPLGKAAMCKEMLREAVKVVDGFQAEIQKKIVTPEENVIIRPS